MACLTDAISYLIIPGLIVAIIILCSKFSKYSATELVGKGRAKDFTTQADIYDTIFALEACVIFILVYKLVCVFRLNPYIDMIYLAVYHSVGMLISYGVILFVFLAACTTLTQAMWGSFTYNYRSFIYGFYYTTINLLGGGNYSSWIYKSSNWSIVFYFFFFIWGVLLLPHVCIGIFAESYRIAALEQGYPEAKKPQKWGLRKYAMWALSCCPLGVRHKMGLTEPGAENADEA